MAVQEFERDLLGGLAAEQRAPGPTLATTSSSSEYAPTVVGPDDHHHTVEKTATRSSKLGEHDGTSEKGVANDGQEEDHAAIQAREDAEAGILTGAKLYLVFISLMLSVFMFALDQSIVATAIPVIVSDFQSFSQVAWTITAYFLTQCGLILLVGQLLTIIKSKYILLAAIFFFELGSLICALAESMPVLIFGRAVQGIGASGMFVSILAVIAVVIKLEQRAAFFGAFGIVFVISSVVGPLLGGVFTERVTWRWCFWINLPFGGIAAAAVVFLLPARDPAKIEGRRTGWKGLKDMDYIGSALILACITCLLLALQWGGNEYAWANWRIILLFILGGLLVPVFFLWERYIDAKALIPLSILKNRTQLGASGFMFFLMCAMLGGTYQLPLFYQAGRHHSPEQSGIDIIPFMLSICIAIFISGGAVTKTGHYYPWLVAGPPIGAIGYGLLYTIRDDTPNAKIIGFQILAGFGIGLCFQNGLLAIQAEYADRPELLPQATGVVSFMQLTGAALGIGVINTVQSVFLNDELRTRAPDVPFELVRQSTEAIYTLPLEQQPAVVESYIIAITKSLIPIIVALGLGWVSALFVRQHNMKKRGVKPGAHAA